MFKNLLPALLIVFILVSCKKKEEDDVKPAPVTPKKPTASVLKLNGGFETGSNLTVGSAFPKRTCSWIVNYTAESQISSYTVRLNGQPLTGYPKLVSISLTNKNDTISYPVLPSDTDTLRFDFVVVDKKGDSAKAHFKLYVKNFKLYTNLYMFTQDVTASDTVGYNLKGASLGNLFSTLTKRAYTYNESLAAGNLIDLTIFGTDGGNYDGIYFISNDRLSVLGGTPSPQALPTQMVLTFTFIDMLSFYNIDWVTFNGYSRNYSNNAFVQTNQLGSVNSRYNFSVSNRCEGMIFIKEIGSLSNPSTNTKKYIKFDMRVYNN